MQGTVSMLVLPDMGERKRSQKDTIFGNGISRMPSEFESS